MTDLENLYQIYKNANSTLDEVIDLVIKHAGQKGAPGVISVFCDRMYDEAEINDKN
jgi:hypothetical protein